MRAGPLPTPRRLRYARPMGIKQAIPLPLRTRLKWLGLAALDVAKPIREPRVPPRRLTSIGGGDFVAVGEDFVRRLIAAGLRPDAVVLDIGCGQGRMARALLPVLTQGRYEGFDIDRAAVAWSSTAYADVPRFNFQWLDVFNSRYNAGGAQGGVRFPFADNLFDAVMVASVFTHMREALIANYLAEMARVMEPGGIALVTAFLRDEAAPARDQLGFAHRIDDHSWTTLPAMPEAAIALRESWFRDQLAHNSLVIRELERGSCFHPGGASLQDFLLLEKVSP